MKLYLDVTKMTFEEDNIEHNIIRGMLNEEFLGYDVIVELPDDDEFIKKTLKKTYKRGQDGKETEEVEEILFDIREKDSWWGFPLYELKDGEIIDFDYTQYGYFAGTDRRMALAFKINELYNPPSEAKIFRKTFKIILERLNIECPEFQEYNDKIETIINKNPKEKK